MPRHRKILWTGLGSRIDGLHTKKEFLDIMYGQFPESVYCRRRGDREVPPGKIKRVDIEEWMNSVGATWTEFP